MSIPVPNWAEEHLSRSTCLYCGKTFTPADVTGSGIRKTSEGKTAYFVELRCHGCLNNSMNVFTCKPLDLNGFVQEIAPLVGLQVSANVPVRRIVPPSEEGAKFFDRGPISPAEIDHLYAIFKNVESYDELLLNLGLSREEIDSIGLEWHASEKKIACKPAVIEAGRTDQVMPAASSDPVLPTRWPRHRGDAINSEAGTCVLEHLKHRGERLIARGNRNEFQGSRVFYIGRCNEQENETEVHWSDISLCQLHRLRKLASREGNVQVEFLFVSFCIQTNTIQYFAVPSALVEQAIESRPRKMRGSYAIHVRKMRERYMLYNVDITTFGRTIPMAASNRPSGEGRTA